MSQLWWRLQRSFARWCRKLLFGELSPRGLLCQRGSFGWLWGYSALALGYSLFPGNMLSGPDLYS